MSTDDAWTAAWTAKKLATHEVVETAEVVGKNLVEISRKKELPGVTVYTTSREKISKSDFEKLAEELGEKQDAVSFVVNLHKEPLITGGAISLSESAGAVIGGLGDLYRALDLADLTTYVHPRVRFILRGLKQHTRVTEVVRLDNRRYEIARGDLPTVTILEFEDYEVTADSLRSRIATFGNFDAFLAANPNARITASAHEVSANTGRPVYMWGELLGALNRRWT